MFEESDHLNDKSDEIKELYEEFKQAILNLDNNIEIIARKLYIAFKKEKNVVCLRVQKKALKMWINLPYHELDDPKRLAKDVTNTGHWGNGDCEIIAQDTQHLEYIMSLIKQSLNKE